MKTPQELFQDNDEQMSAALEFEQELEAVEQSLKSLKERYQQVQQDQQTQAQLQQRQSQLEQQMQRSPNPGLKAELQQLQSRIDELEVNLESRLFSWDSFKEPFWQVIRFGGLGVVIGWFMAVAFTHTPQPNPQPSASTQERTQP